MYDTEKFQSTQSKWEVDDDDDADDDDDDDINPMEWFYGFFNS